MTHGRSAAQPAFLRQAGKDPGSIFGLIFTFTPLLNKSHEEALKL